MIFYRNFTGRQVRDRRDEIEAIRHAKGTKVLGFPDFELIELVFDRAAKSPIKRHGYQDTDVIHEDNGEIKIQHRLEGAGTLRFEPTNYGNPVGYLAKTPKNMDMLIHCYNSKDFRFMDSAIEGEVKKGFEAYWAQLPEKAKKELAMRQQRAKMSMMEAPELTLADLQKQGSVVRTDVSNDRVLQELADMKAENERLKAEISGGKPTPPPEASPVIEEPVPDPNTVTAKDGTLYEFTKMPMMDVRKVAKKYGIVFGATTEKATLIPQLLETIEKEKTGELVV